MVSPMLLWPIRFGLGQFPPRLPRRTVLLAAPNRLSPNPQPAAIEIKIKPLEPDRLADPQASKRHGQEQHGVELAGLFAE